MSEIAHLLWLYGESAFVYLLCCLLEEIDFRDPKLQKDQLKAKLLKAKKECGPHDKPEVVKTHLRDMIVIPEMIGSVVGVHNGKVFTTVEVKADMVGHYLGEFSITYKPVRHGLSLIHI